uniref:Uncharacterized protein n=1 Tax=Arundo donax TaxID=35708 RepID=A0A0A8Z560_ARUDO
MTRKFQWPSWPTETGILI